MVDYAAAVDDDMLAALDVPKGGRRIVSAAEKASVMERLQGYNSQVGSSCRQAAVALVQADTVPTATLQQGSRSVMGCGWYCCEKHRLLCMISSAVEPGLVHTLCGRD